MISNGTYSKHMNQALIRIYQKGSTCVRDWVYTKKMPAGSHNVEPDHGISGAGLKGVAMICMLLDHSGAVLIWPLLQEHRLVQGWTFVYWMVRAVGRMSFPIYCFLLAEGFARTKSVQKYLMRLLSCGLISEVPYDMTFSGRMCDWHSQNVLFTIFLGLSALVILKKTDFEKENRLHHAKTFTCVLCIAIFAGTAEICHSDYGAAGVLLIICMYHFRERTHLRNLVSGMLLLTVSPLEVTASASFVLLQRYNGIRGNQSQFGMYLFYPGHLMLLCLARYFVFY